MVLTSESWIVDWAVAAPWRPADEVVRSALSVADWSDPRIAAAFITSYQDRSGTDLVFDGTCLAADLAIGIDWLARCLRRASGVESCSAHPKEEASKQATEQIAALPSRVTIADHIRTWLQH